jgi:hypothetical protein
MSPCQENETPAYIDGGFSYAIMTNICAQMQVSPASPTTACQRMRRISHSGSCKFISFEAVTPGLLVRTTDDGHILALDFISTLTKGDRKKASQTLARVASRPDTALLLTLRRVACKPKARKLLSFSNAVQLLLVLPKRTVSMDTRRMVAGILTDHFEYRYQGGGGSIDTDQPVTHTMHTDEERGVCLWRTRVDLKQKEMDLERQRVYLERQRMCLPLEKIHRCVELMDKCGPMSEDEQRKFRALISEQAAGALGGGGGQHT